MNLVAYEEVVTVLLYNYILCSSFIGDHKLCEVHIVECKEFKNTIDNMLTRANAANFLQSSSWAEQFREAFQVEAGGDDDGDDDAEAEPSYSDYVMHYLSLFWKVFFAFVPPTDIWGGWACFVVAIGMIGLLTTVTGDLASHFGCTVGLADSVVAISFVALGTSLPGMDGFLCNSYHASNVINKNLILMSKRKEKGFLMVFVFVIIYAYHHVTI